MAALPARVVLIRHGESQATIAQIPGGHATCKGLTDRGRRQAEALRDRLVRTRELRRVTGLYTSLLPRAIETAEIIAPALGAPEAVRDCGLCEVHMGDDVDEMTFEEIESRYGPYPTSQYEPWLPGAESWAEFVARVGRCLVTILSGHDGGTVVLVCHGGVLAASFAVLGQLPLSSRLPALAVNTSITEWAPRGDGRCELVRYNDAAHLAGLD